MTLTLNIWAAAAVLVRSFIMNQTGLFKGTVNNIHSAFHKAFLIRIFDSQKEIAAFMFGNQIGIQCCS